MSTRRFSTASIRTGSKSNKMWDQDTQQGAMVPIATSDMYGNVTAFGFGSIPQIYQDLVIVASMRSTSSAAAGWIINGNPGGVTYGVTTLLSNGSTTTSVRGSSMSYGASLCGNLGSTSGIQSTLIAHFPNYANTTTKKTFIVRTATDLNGSGNVAVETFGNSLTGAITDIACSTANAGIFWYGTVTLYGIKASA